MPGGKGGGAGMGAREFRAMRRRRNYAVFGGILLLCLIFYAITIVKVGGALWVR